MSVAGMIKARLYPYKYTLLAGWEVRIKKSVIVILKMLLEALGLAREEFSLDGPPSRPITYIYIFDIQ